MKKWSLDDIVLLAIICFVILFPALQFEPYRTNDTFNHRRMVQVGLLGILGLMAILPHNLRRLSALVGSFSNYIKTALIGIVLLGGFATLGATFWDWSLLAYGHYLLLLIITFFVAAIAYENPSKALGYVIVCIAGLVVFYLARVAHTYILYQLGEFRLWPSTNRTIALFGFGTIRTFNHLQTWSIPILVSLGWYAWRYSPKKWLQWALIAATVGVGHAGICIRGARRHAGSRRWCYHCLGGIR